MLREIPVKLGLLEAAIESSIVLCDGLWLNVTNKDNWTQTKFLNGVFIGAVEKVMVLKTMLVSYIY
jgi:hypothetical protein